MASATIGKGIPEITAGSDSTLREEDKLKEEIFRVTMDEVQKIEPWLRVLDYDTARSARERELEEQHKRRGWLRGVLDHMLHGDHSDEE